MPEMPDTRKRTLSVASRTSPAKRSKGSEDEEETTQKQRRDYIKRFRAYFGIPLDAPDPLPADYIFPGTLTDGASANAPAFKIIGPMITECQRVGYPFNLDELFDILQPILQRRGVDGMGVLVDVVTEKDSKEMFAEIKQRIKVWEACGRPTSMTTRVVGGKNVPTDTISIFSVELEESVEKGIPSNASGLVFSSVGGDIKLDEIRRIRHFHNSKSDERYPAMYFVMDSKVAYHAEMPKVKDSGWVLQNVYAAIKKAAPSVGTVWSRVAQASATPSSMRLAAQSGLPTLVLPGPVKPHRSVWGEDVFKALLSGHARVDMQMQTGYFPNQKRSVMMEALDPARQGCLASTTLALEEGVASPKFEELCGCLDNSFVFNTLGNIETYLSSFVFAPSMDQNAPRKWSKNGKLLKKLLVHKKFLCAQLYLQTAGTTLCSRGSITMYEVLLGGGIDISRYGATGQMGHRVEGMIALGVPYLNSFVLLTLPSAVACINGYCYRSLHQTVAAESELSIVEVVRLALFAVALPDATMRATLKLDNKTTIQITLTLNNLLFPHRKNPLIHIALEVLKHFQDADLPSDASIVPGLDIDLASLPPKPPLGAEAVDDEDSDDEDEESDGETERLAQEEKEVREAMAAAQKQLAEIEERKRQRKGKGKAVAVEDDDEEDEDESQPQTPATQVTLQTPRTQQQDAEGGNAASEESMTS